MTIRARISLALPETKAHPMSNLSWHARHKERAKENEKRWRLANPNKIKEKNRRYHQLHPKQYKEAQKRWRCNNIERTRQKEKQTKRVQRLAVITYYGGHCACCGETRLEFLGIDHLNGNGSAHRKQIHGHIYRWLKQNNYPKEFRVLCHNCNMARGFYGYCPHERTESAAMRKDA